MIGARVFRILIISSISVWCVEIGRWKTSGERGQMAADTSSTAEIILQFIKLFFYIGHRFAGDLY